MMRDGFTYATEPDKNGQVTVVEYGRDPDTGRMQVVSAVQKTVRNFEVGGGASTEGGGSYDSNSSEYGGDYGGYLESAQAPAPSRSMVDIAIDNAVGWGVGKINEAINNPIATAINTVVGIAAGPVGLANTVSGLFGGPTIGGLATAAGRAVGENLGISNQSSPGAVSAGIGPSAGITGLAAGIGPAKGDYGDLGGYGADSYTPSYYPMPENPGMTTTPPVTPPSYGIGQPGGSTTPPPSPPPPLPPYNPVVASTMPFFSPTQPAGSGMSPLSPFYVPETSASIFTPPPIQGYGIAALPGYGQGAMANGSSLV